MSYVKQNFPTKTECISLQQYFESIGTPTENRVLIWTPNKKTVNSGIIIPDNVKEDIPRKGVVIDYGPISDEYDTYRKIVLIGYIVTFGMYAGKEVEFDPNFLTGITRLENVNTDFTDGKFHVLSLNEIIFVEYQNN